jgi:hypothetical protein
VYVPAGTLANEYEPSGPLVAGGIGVPWITMVALATGLPSPSLTTPETVKLAAAVSAKSCVVVWPSVMVTLAVPLSNPNADTVTV